MLKRIAGWGVVVLLLAGLYAVLVSEKPPSVQSFRKADGSLVTLIAVTYGTNQSVVFGPPYRRVLYKLLPAKLKKLAKVSAHSFTTSMPDIPTFWFHEEIGGGFLTVRSLDEYGCEFSGATTSKSFMPVGSARGRSPSTEYISRYQVSGSYPNGKIIGLRVYDTKSDAKLVATIWAPGGVLKKLPEWKPYVPCLARDGGMTFELKELVTGLQSMPFKWVFNVTNGDYFTEAVFHITGEGASARGWYPSDIQIADARGVKTWTWNAKKGCGSKKGDLVLNWQGILDPRRGPWKLNVTFSNQSTNRVVEFEATPVMARSVTASEN